MNGIILNGGLVTNNIKDWLYEIDLVYFFVMEILLQNCTKIKNGDENKFESKT